MSLCSGIGAGSVLALVLNQVLSRWVGGSVSDPLVLAGGRLLLASVAALASGLPARLAASINPVQALRAE